MSKYSQEAWKNQQHRNDQLIENSKFMRSSVTSKVLPFSIDIANTNALDQKQIETLQALEIEAARISISSLASLATIGELDHLGGGLDLIPSLMLHSLQQITKKFSTQLKMLMQVLATMPL